MNRTAMSSEIGNIQRNLAYSALICMCCYLYKKSNADLTFKRDKYNFRPKLVGRFRTPQATSCPVLDSNFLMDFKFEKSVVYNGNQCNIQFKLNFYDNV